MFKNEEIQTQQDMNKSYEKPGYKINMKTLLQMENLYFYISQREGQMRKLQFSSPLPLSLHSKCQKFSLVKMI
jgi:hypothetical protein